jgi:hypothetical protein
MSKERRFQGRGVLSGLKMEIVKRPALAFLRVPAIRAIFSSRTKPPQFALRLRGQFPGELLGRQITAKGRGLSTPHR